MYKDILYGEVRYFPIGLCQPSKEGQVLVVLREQDKSMFAWWEGGKFYDQDNQEIHPSYWAALPTTKGCYYTNRRVADER